MFSTDPIRDFLESIFGPIDLRFNSQFGFTGLLLIGLGIAVLIDQFQ